MQERLQKIIARAGIASRRHAEQLILSGQVRVNGRVVTELGTKADAATDRIEAAGRVVKGAEGRVYLVLNKPPGIVSAMADPERRKTLKNCLRGFPARVYPVGNLEYTASGLVFLTNDGDLAAEMLKRWGELEQVYLVKVKGMLTLEELERLGKEIGVRMKTVRQPDAARRTTVRANARFASELVTPTITAVTNYEPLRARRLFDVEGGRKALAFRDDLGGTLQVQVIFVQIIVFRHQLQGTRRREHSHRAADQSSRECGGDCARGSRAGAHGLARAALEKTDV